jgi:PPIC-type PPIASE domain
VHAVPAPEKETFRRTLPESGVRAGRCALAVAGVLVGLAGCAGNARSPVVVRVGAVPISRATVDHWARVIVRGGLITGPYADTKGTAKQRALAFLISSQWLRGEAAAQKVTPTDKAVNQALTDRREANGAGEFEQTMHASGQTLADVKLEIETELAAVQIRRKLISQTPPVTEREVLTYYRNDQRLYRKPEARVVDLIENLPSRAAATALVKRIGTGADFAKKALHEELVRYTSKAPFADIESVTHAIFTAHLGVVSAPMSLNGRWTVFVVRKITPASPEPLANVRPKIIARLASHHRNHILAAFTHAYRTRWTAKTNCRPGYIIQACARYEGPLQAQPDPLASG